MPPATGAPLLAAAGAVADPGASSVVPATSGDRDYAGREARHPQAASFRGGDGVGIYIGSGAGLVIILLLVLLLVR